MVRIEFVPGAIATPNAITIPAGTPDIQAVVLAQICRLPAGLADHAPADIVAAIADHAVHSHDLTVGAVAMAVPAGASAGGNDLVDGAGQLIPAADPTGVNDIAGVQAHAGSAVDVVHAGGNSVVAAVPTIITTRTFSLDVNTLVGDVVALDYLEVGERVLVS